ncbi:MAG: hypothetical protein ABI461_11665, partial [Polyangiaceae bacterium]
MQDANVRPRTASPTPTCPACGKDIDPLRAGQVAIENGVFVYFCDAACKREAFEGRSSRIRETMTSDPPPVSIKMTPTPPPVESLRMPVDPPRSEKSRAISDPAIDAPKSTLLAAPTTTAGPVSGERISSQDGTEEILPAAPTTLRSIRVDEAKERAGHAERNRADEEERRAPAVPSKRGVDRKKRLDLLAAVGVGAGLLAAALLLGGPATEGARIPFAAAAVLALVARVLLAPRDSSSPNLISVLLPPCAALLLATWARLHGDVHASALASLTGLAAAASLLITALIDRSFEAVKEEREATANALDVDVRVVRKGAKEDEIVKTPASAVKPGEHVVVEAGDVVGVDALVVAGEASVLPWLGAHVEATKKEGDAIVAGAKLVSGRLRLMTTW